MCQGSIICIFFVDKKQLSSVNLMASFDWISDIVLP
uniref:Uncharacterized protein n=1 Tax=Arundo donax TaxID=35708 RepID=A0A0A9AS30_ARUDO